MSGPKVVNIEAVRRLQKRKGLAQLRKLCLALDECERLQAQPQALASLARLETLHQTEQWDTLLTESTQLSEFYESEADRLRQQQASQQADRLRQAYRFQQSVTQMTGHLQNLPVSAKRDSLIHKLASSESSVQESALNAVLNYIAKNQKAQTSSRLSELAVNLLDSRLASSTPFIPQAPADSHQQRLDKCWNLLGELSALEDSPVLQNMSTKARSISDAPTEQQALLLDSLALELSSHLHARRITQALRHEMEICLAELEEIHNPAADGWKQRLINSVDQVFQDLKSARQLVDETRAWIEHTFAEETRIEQRAAVLNALVAAGYEVRDGMAAAWVEQGRLVLRKPNKSDYGIEIVAPTQGNFVQTRVVALTNSTRDPQRDLQEEETWCNEFHKARDYLDEFGFKASLVQAHAAGSIPIKVVSSANEIRFETAEKSRH